MATQADPREFDLQEQLARIRKMGAEQDQAQAYTRKLLEDARLAAVDVDKRHAEIKKLEQDTEHAAKDLLLRGLIAGAGMTAAVAALVKVFL